MTTKVDYFHFLWQWYSPQWLIMKSPLLFDNQTSTLYKYTFQQFILKTITSHIFLIILSLYWITSSIWILCDPSLKYLQDEVRQGNVTSETLVRNIIYQLIVSVKIICCQWHLSFKLFRNFIYSYRLLTNKHEILTFI